MKGRSWIPKRFLGALAITAGAVTVDYLFFDFIPNVYALRYSLILLGFLLILDIFKHR
jgi:hypothetical protein